jgi:hypothetical protein
MYIRELHVENVKLLRDFRLSFLRDGKPRMWTVLIGENGLCKTTVLQAIALAASGPDRANQLADVPSLPDRRLKKAKATIEAEFDFTPGMHKQRKYPGLGKRPAKPPQIQSSLSIKAGWNVFDGDSGYKSSKSKSHGDNPLRAARAEGLPLWFVAGYGVARIGAGPANDPAKEMVVSRLDSLFDRGRPFATGAVFDDIALLHDFVNMVWSAFALQREILPHAYLHGFGIQPTEKGGTVQARDLRFTFFAGTEELVLDLESLSQGYKATAIWIIDLMYQMMKDADSAVDPKNMAGLVLIDEIDLHLHPRWQIALIPSLKALFPKVQFVVTTHSPMVLPGLERDEVVILGFDDQGNVVAKEPPASPALMTGSEIYDTFFGLQSLYPNALGEQLRRYGFLVGNPARTDAEDAEMRRLRDTLKNHGVDPGWKPVKRGASLEDDDEVIP